MVKKILTFLFIVLMMFSVAFISSCGKDREPTNNGLFTITPVVPVEDSTINEPVSALMSWTMRVSNWMLNADTALISYAFENNLHVFRCNPSGSDIISIYLTSLDSSLYTVDLDNYKIEYVQNGIMFNAANSPQGIIHLFRNAGNKISANYSARVFNLSAGQERLITDGRMRNIPYTP